MGLSSQDLHSQKKHTRLYKIPKFGVNRPNIDEDTDIKKRENLQRNLWIFSWKFEMAVSRSSLALLAPNVRVL